MDVGPASPPGQPGLPPRRPVHQAQIHQVQVRSCVPPPPPQPPTPHRQSPPPRRGSPAPPGYGISTTAPINREINITLDMVRERPRATNEYVDTPTAIPTPRGGALPPHHHHHHSPLSHHHRHAGNGTTTTTMATTCVQLSPALETRLPVSPITQQPTVKKDPNFMDNSSECKLSIYCPQCHKCRCGQCTGTKELPSRWLCNNKCELSVQKLVDMTSCLCAVRCMFYHCCSNADGDTSVSAADDPCACCDVPNCGKRWTCMGLMSLALPCLCLYWPMRCGLWGCTMCYNKCCRRQGCRCHKDKVPGSKHLLLDSESSSA